MISSRSYTIAVLIFCLCLSGCADPVVMTPLSPKERENLTQDLVRRCALLQEELAVARQNGVEARSEDRFKLRYILIAPALLSMYRMNQAEDAATARQQELEQLAAEAHCTASK